MKEIILSAVSEVVWECLGGQSNSANLHQFLQQKLAELAESFEMKGIKEYRVNVNGGTRRIDVVWLKGEEICLACEIDGTLNAGSLEKLLAVEALLRFWIYYGQTPPDVLLQQADPEKKILVLWYPEEERRKIYLLFAPVPEVYLKLFLILKDAPFTRKENTSIHPALVGLAEELGILRFDVLRAMAGSGLGPRRLYQLWEIVTAGGGGVEDYTALLHGIRWFLPLAHSFLAAGYGVPPKFAGQEDEGENSQGGEL